jgi:hypothetical protein
MIFSGLRRDSNERNTLSVQVSARDSTLLWDVLPWSIHWTMQRHPEAIPRDSTGTIWWSIGGRSKAQWANVQTTWNRTWLESQRTWTTSSARSLQRCALGCRLSPSGKPHGLSLRGTGLSSPILPRLLAPAPPLLLPLFTWKKRKMSQIHQHHNPTPKIIRPWYNSKEINGYGFTSQAYSEVRRISLKEILILTILVPCIYNDVWWIRLKHVLSNCIKISNLYVGSFAFRNLVSLPCTLSFVLLEATRPRLLGLAPSLLLGLLLSRAWKLGALVRTLDTLIIYFPCLESVALTGHYL